MAAFFPRPHCSPPGNAGPPSPRPARSRVELPRESIRVAAMFLGSSPFELRLPHPEWRAFGVCVVFIAAFFTVPP